MFIHIDMYITNLAEKKVGCPKRFIGEQSADGGCIGREEEGGGGGDSEALLGNLKKGNWA